MSAGPILSVHELIALPYGQATILVGEEFAEQFTRNYADIAADLFDRAYDEKARSPKVHRIHPGFIEWKAGEECSTCEGDGNLYTSSRRHACECGDCCGEGEVDAMRFFTDRAITRLANSWDNRRLDPEPPELEPWERVLDEISGIAA